MTLKHQLDVACAELLGQCAVEEQRYREFVDAIEAVFESAKLEALAEFAAGAGHEINNPVATIVGRAQMLLADSPDPETAYALQIIGGQALRIRDMIADVMLFARPPHPRPEFHRIADVFHLAMESQSDLILANRAIVEIECPAESTVWADRTHLLILITSLLRNSLENAQTDAVQVKLITAVQFRQDVSGMLLSVIDNGPGISAEIRDHLFDPFYSGRQAGRGLGFGLAKCWRIAQMHGATLDVNSPTNGGTRFDIWFPQPASAVVNP